MFLGECPFNDDGCLDGCAVFDYENNCCSLFTMAKALQRLAPAPKAGEQQPQRPEPKSKFKELRMSDDEL